MIIQEFNEGLFKFLQASPTPFHATQSLSLALENFGFEQLKEESEWHLQDGGKYFITRNDSSLIAFSLPSQTPVQESGIHMVGAHTDSPCLKIKPAPLRIKESSLQLGVEVYGGALLAPWFDRDLSIAGRLHYLGRNEYIEQCLIDFEQPVAIIPSLAIHLNRKANQGHTINPQLELYPMIGQKKIGDSASFQELLHIQAQKQSIQDMVEVLDHELYLYDTQPPSTVGLNSEYIASARLDNLLSCYTATISMVEAGSEMPSLIYFSDHEEVGSQSAAGAGGNFLESVLKRISPNPECYYRMIAQSMMLSTDNAHAVHPNYSDKHDEQHKPLMNQGVVIKVNAKQRYASNSETQSYFRQLCKDEEVPVQDFVCRNDMPCGSTIGPIAATELGVKTLDIGVPTLAMHSCRELAGYKDAFSLYRALCAYFQKQTR